VNWIRIVISGIAALFVVAPSSVGAEETKDLSEIELAKQDQDPLTRFYVMRSASSTSRPDRRPARSSKRRDGTTVASGPACHFAPASDRNAVVIRAPPSHSPASRKGVA